MASPRNDPPKGPTESNPRRTFRIAAGRGGINVTIDEDEFWQDAILIGTGHTAFDENLDALVEGIRSVCYTILTLDKAKH